MSTLETNPTIKAKVIQNQNLKNPQIEESTQPNHLSSKTQSEIKEESIATDPTTIEPPSEVAKRTNQATIETSPTNTSQMPDIIASTTENYNNPSSNTNENKISKKKPNKKTNVTIIEPAAAIFISDEQESETREAESGEHMEIPCDVIIKEDPADDSLCDPLAIDTPKDFVETVAKLETPSNELELIENTQSTTISVETNNAEENTQNTSVGNNNTTKTRVENHSKHVKPERKRNQSTSVENNNTDTMENHAIHIKPERNRTQNSSVENNNTEETMENHAKHVKPERKQTQNTNVENNNTDTSVENHSKQSKPSRKRKPRRKTSRKKPRGQNVPPGISKYADLIANTKLETCNRYQCDQCASSFSTIYSLNAHLLRHEGKIYACEFCGKSFGAKATLHHHLQIHEGFKYTCDRCPAEFTLKHSWKRHMLIHAGVRYSCFACDKSFSRRTDLNAHLDVHKGFVGSCYHCKKTFANKKSLREHLLIHRGIRFQCDYCDKSYSERKTIRKHYRKKHNIDYGQ